MRGVYEEFIRDFEKYLNGKIPVTAIEVPAGLNISFKEARRSTVEGIASVCIGYQINCNTPSEMVFEGTYDIDVIKINQLQRLISDAKEKEKRLWVYVLWKENPEYGFHGIFATWELAAISRLDAPKEFEDEVLRIEEIELNKLILPS